MPRGISLSTEEQAIILALFKEGNTVTSISAHVNRSRDAIRRVIQRGEVCQNSARRGPRSKLMKSGVRLLIRKARSGLFTARELQAQYAPMLTVRRVQQILSDVLDLVWERPVKTLPLTSEHKSKRLDWAKLSLNKGVSHWRRTVFSDESRFNLDGPDGCRSYWRDKRRAGRYMISRRNGGSGLMIWGAFSWRGKSPLVFVEGTMDTTQYVQVIHNVLVPWMDSEHPMGAVFQQDNAPPHTSKATKEFMLSIGLDVMDWPANSPDLNPIENLWANMAKTIYHNGRQFECKEDLKEALMYAWDNIKIKELRNLVSSMSDRCIACIEAKGDKTKY